MHRNMTFLLTVVLGVVIWGILFVAIEPLAQRISAYATVKESLEQLLASAGAPTSGTSKTLIISEGSFIPRLPASLTAVVDEPFALYFDGIVSGKEPDAFLVDIASKTLMGTADQRHWHLIPKESDIGTHTLTVTVRDWSDAVLAQQSVSVEVIKTPKIQKPLKILLIGDSLTRSTLYPQALYERLNTWAPGQIQFVGNQHTTAQDPSEEEIAACSRHESCNGWTWKLFASHYAPGEEERYKLTRSPFVFVDEHQSNPKLDVSRYLAEQDCANGIDFVIFALGWNEVFGVNLNKTNSLSKSLDKMLPWTDQLVSAFKTACPNAQIGIALPIPFTRSSASFARTYQHVDASKSDPWRSRQIQDGLAERLLAHFESDPNVFLIPMNATLDIVEGYSSKDASHPNRLGAQQMADAVYFEILRRQSSQRRKLEFSILY